jgi:large subunit ribosomal protein L32e
MTERKSFLPRRALKARKRAKKNKPDFVRQESWRYMKLKENWRRPRGLDNKMRRKIKGWPPTVSTGYKGPRIARGLHPSGCREVLVHNVKEVSDVDPKTQAIRIAHTVGSKKRAQIIAEAKKRKVFILNAKEVKAPVEETKAEEEEAKPEGKQKKPVEKAEKPKRTRKKVAQEAQELPVKGRVKSEKSGKAAKTGEGAEGQ